MFSKILLAYDGSGVADQAFGYAVDLAGRYQAPLIVLAIARPPDFADDVELVAMLEKEEEGFQVQFVRMRELAAGAGIAAEFRCLVGHPTEQIIKYAEAHGVGLIIVGHRRRSLLERLFLGSTSLGVLAHAPCAVMVVR